MLPRPSPRIIPSLWIKLHKASFSTSVDAPVSSSAQCAHHVDLLMLCSVMSGECWVWSCCVVMRSSL